MENNCMKLNFGEEKLLMERIQVSCDACEKEWIIFLTNAEIPLATFESMSCDIENPSANVRPLERTYHFCGKTCLKNWVNEEKKEQR